MDASILTRLRGLALAAGLGAMPMAVLASIDDGTITVESVNAEPICQRGYIGMGNGSYSPTGLTGGTTVSYLYTMVVGMSCTGIYNGYFGVSGFSSNPGQSWLTSVACNGVTVSGGAATYSYSSGRAEWIWGGLPGDSHQR